MPFSLHHKRIGFTLIELLLAIGIIGILAAVIIVAINPTRQINDAHNAKRRSDVNTILNGVYQYMVDNSGDHPAPLTSTGQEICIFGVACPSGISLDAISGTYLASMPLDPDADPLGTGTDYFIYVDAFQRVTITAPNAELGISISR